MRPDNPFSSRFVRPDAHPFFFPPGEDLEEVGARWQAQGWWGELVGPHGTGKSTLLNSLLGYAAARGRRPRRFFLNDRQLHLPRLWWLDPTPTLYAIDGAELLSASRFRRFCRYCRLRRCGLLITTHASLGLPLLYATTAADGETIRRVVAGLAGAEHTPELPLADELAVRHQGNLRNVLFELYDRNA